MGLSEKIKIVRPSIDVNQHLGCCAIHFQNLMFLVNLIMNNRITMAFHTVSMLPYLRRTFFLPQTVPPLDILDPLIFSQSTQSVLWKVNPKDFEMTS